MAHRTRIVLAAVVVLLASGGMAYGADSDSKLSREREMLRRTQEALRQSQADSAEQGRVRTEAERKLKEVTDKLEAEQRTSRSAQASARAQQLSAATSETQLSAKLSDANQQLAALAIRQKETTEQLAARQAELRTAQQDLAASRSANTSCEAKNLQLYEYSRELMQHFEQKGVWAAMTQKEPVLGLQEVKVQNLIQEYQEKLDSQKILVRPAGTPGSH